MANRLPSNYPDIGTLGEELVAQFLQSKGWVILHQRWSCPWGEIDIIARQGAAESLSGGSLRSELSKRGSGDKGAGNISNPAPLSLRPAPLLAFIEVKTRSPGNWDAWGMLSINRRKKTKLCQTAQCYLAAYPHLVDYPCRFDVALVGCQPLPKKQKQESGEASGVTITSPDSLLLPLQPAQVKANDAGYQLFLKEYIASAFD